ncbi:MAG: phage tail terminator-like protein [Brevundimonas sp.]|uniref:phage tail terminator-like protein n=1 Tax=Brevundimonas sp. TaxID=1871086 RepID=UPI003001E3C4
MAEDADIIRALFLRCQTLSVGSPALPITFPEPGAAYAPPEDGKYLRVDVFLNRPAWEGLTSGAMHQGLLQITVNWPRQDGVLAPVRIADQIKAHFPKALALVENGTKVTISGKPYPSSPITEPDRVTVPVTIPWQAV